MKANYTCEFKKNKFAFNHLVITQHLFRYSEKRSYYYEKIMSLLRCDNKSKLSVVECHNNVMLTPLNSFSLMLWQLKQKDIR